MVNKKKERGVREGACTVGFGAISSMASNVRLLGTRVLGGTIVLLRTNMSRGLNETVHIEKTG